MCGRALGVVYFSCSILRVIEEMAEAIRSSPAKKVEEGLELSYIRLPHMLIPESGVIATFTDRIVRSMFDIPDTFDSVFSSSESAG